MNEIIIEIKNDGQKIFKIDVGNMPKEKIIKYLDKIKKDQI